MATITPADVLVIRDQVKAEDPELTPEQVIRGMRTLVHARLMQDDPMPYLLPDPDPGKSHTDFLVAQVKASRIRDDAQREAELRRLHAEERLHHHERTMRAKASVSAEHALAYEQSRSNPALAGAVDAHHFAQREHSKALWLKADQLVAAAMNGGV